MSLGLSRGMFVSAVTLAVAWVTSATARYADYSGARMPFYHEDYHNRDSLPRDDYPERSPDASVPLDYKYEEPSSGKYEGQTENSVEENDAWQIDKKNNRPIDEEEDYNNNIDKYSEERESNHRVEDRPSTKGKKLKKDDHNLSHQGRRRFTNSKSRSRYWDQVEDDRDIQTRNKIDIRNKFRPRGEVRRAGRRKAREREDVTSEAIFEADRNFESSESSEEESLSLQGIRRRVGYDRRKDDSSFIPRDLGSMADKNYPNYEEYYDMKRALNIRNNLLPNPRTKVSETPMQLSVRPLENWFRRANIPEASGERATLSESTSSLLQNTTTSAVTTTLSTVNRSLKTTVHLQNSSDLSLAEKSRLSILKKAQRKESIGGNTLTTKPPVLMQVTDRLQTVVMVESPGSHLQRMQAREISDDSPDRIARAKQVQESSSTTSVAERELSAVLSRHQRAEVEDPGGPTSRALDIDVQLPTFPKGALDLEQQHHGTKWGDLRRLNVRGAEASSGRAVTGAVALGSVQLFIRRACRGP
ncbi:unnamed protein product [Pieris brassicae]|nr:unnamed protein product [Pieris brassicae]